jgi:DUF2975 family protein
LTNGIDWFIPCAMSANEISSKANFRMNRIQKVSKCIRLFLLYGIPIMVVCFFASGFFISKGWLDNQLQTPDGIMVTKLNQTLKAHETAVLLEEVFSLAIFLFWYRTTLKLFGYFEKGILFTAETVRCIQILGGIYIVKFLLHTAFSFFIPAVDFPVHTEAAKGLSALFAGLPLIFIGWLIDEARKIREEQELTV